MERGLPLNVYRGPQRLMVTTTAPGLEPQNIRIEMKGRRLSIQGAMRGLGQERKQGYLREWTVGSYQRTVDLPESVDASRAKASYDNGVLVVIFPLSPPADLGRHHVIESRHRQGTTHPACRPGSAPPLAGGGP